MGGYMAFVTGAGTTLRGDVLTYDGLGVLDNIGVISLQNESLFIIDSETGFLKAYFNLPAGEIPSFIQSENQSFFSNTTTGFLGDVNNFDDINAQSRFKEKNLNNGSAASAAFVAENDVNFTTAFGIGSSNFAFGNTSFNNEGAIFHNAPSKFNYANGDFFGWNWRANQGGFQNSTDFVESMQLSPGGNLNIDGNFTGNQHYGEMFGIHINSPEVIVIDEIAIINNSGIFNTFKITGFQGGMGNGVEFFNNSLIVNVSGLYDVRFSITYEDSAQGRHGFTINLNGNPIRKISGAGYLANANDVRTVSSSGFRRLQEGDVLELMVGDRFAPPTDIDVAISEVSIIRIGS